VSELLGQNKPHPDVRATVYKLAVMSGDEAAFEEVVRLYKQVGRRQGGWTAVQAARGGPWPDGWQAGAERGRGTLPCSRSARPHPRRPSRTNPRPPLLQERSAIRRAQLMSALSRPTTRPLIRRALELALDPDVRTQVGWRFAGRAGGQGAAASNTPAVAVGLASEPGAAVETLPQPQTPAPNAKPQRQPRPRPQDIGGLVAGVGLRGGLAFNMTWEFVTRRVDAIFARFKGEPPRGQGAGGGRALGAARRGAVDAAPASLASARPTSTLTPTFRPTHPPAYLPAHPHPTPTPAEGNAMYSFGRRLNDLAPLFTDDASFDAVKAFSEAHPGVLSPTFLDAATEALHRNQQWLQKQGGEACAWLEEAAARGAPGPFGDDNDDRR
jgi:hypothetical protein